MGANRSEGEEDSIRFIMPVGSNVQRVFSCVQRHHCTLHQRKLRCVTYKRGASCLQKDDYTLRKCHRISANLGKLTRSDLNLKNLRFPRIEDGLGRFLTLAKRGRIIPVLDSWESNNPKILFPPIRSCEEATDRKQLYFYRGIYAPYIHLPVWLVAWPHHISADAADNLPDDLGVVYMTLSPSTIEMKL